MTIRPSHSILILGAGLTGLTAAYHLSRQGHRITLLDHPRWQEGFRANSADPAPILFGCHRETWRLLHALDGGASFWTDTTIPLEFRLPDGRIVAYRSTHLPGALQWMMSLFTFHGLVWHDRWTLFSHLEQLWEQAQSLPADLESRMADEWLASIGQSREARDRIWNPLAQWLTGNALVRLSAGTFVRLLSTVFLGQAVDAGLTHLDGSVGDRFFTPLRIRLERLGVAVQRLSDIPTIRFGQDGVTGVRTQDGAILQADWYIAALPHQRLLALLPERLLTRYAYFARLSELKALPEIAVQLTWRSTSRTPRLLLPADRPFHRLTITPLGPQEIRCRLSATDNHALSDLHDDQLIKLGRTELRALYPEGEASGMQPTEIYREEQAALSLKPGVALLRPIQQSPIRNLLVAGAWTDTGWPADIESAIASAGRCVSIITGPPP